MKFYCALTAKCEEKNMTLLFLFRLILSDVEIIREMWRELILLRYRAVRFLQLKPRANRRNIVGQQLPTLLDVTCFARLHTLLHVEACCWELSLKV